MKVSYFYLLLNICCIPIVLKTVFFCTFWRLRTAVLWWQILQILLIFVYLLCPKNDTIDFRKTFIIQELVDRRKLPDPLLDFWCSIDWCMIYALISMSWSWSEVPTCRDKATWIYFFLSFLQWFICISFHV